MRKISLVDVIIGGLLLVAGGPRTAFAQTLNDPIGLTNQFSISQVHLSTVARSARLVEESKFDFRVGGAITNTFNSTDTYRIDSEDRALSLDARFGIAPDWEFGARTGLRWRGGGVLDHAIRTWHAKLGLPEGKRDGVRNNEYRIDGIREDSGRFEFLDNGYSLSTLTLSVANSLFASENNAVSVAFFMDLPTARATFGHNGIDAAAQILGTHNFERYQLSAGLSLVAITDDEIGGLQYDPLRTEGFLSLGATVNSWLGIVTSLYAGQAGISNMIDYSNYFLYLDIGPRFKLSPSVCLELLMREDLAPKYGTADISLLAGVRISE